MAFPVEDIPGIDRLYYRVHKTWIEETGEPKPGAFRDIEDGMSTDWSKYSTPAESRGRSKVPGDNGILGLTADDVRKIEPLQIRHTPIFPTNRAHTDVLGKKTTEIRLKLLRAANWEIRRSDPV